MRGRRGGGAPAGGTGDSPGDARGQPGASNLHGRQAPWLPRPPPFSGQLSVGRVSKATLGFEGSPGGLPAPPTAVPLIVTARHRESAPTKSSPTAASGRASKGTCAWPSPPGARTHHVLRRRGHLQGARPKPARDRCPELLRGPRDTARWVDGLPVRLHPASRSSGAGGQPPSHRHTEGLSP